MPHFMDVHTDLQGVSLAEIEQAHMRDVDAQERHEVRYLQLFHSPATGQVFCLAEGPSAEACEAVHVEANGMRPNAIIQVEPELVDRFLGGGSATPAGVALGPSGESDTGLRAILFTDIVGSTRLAHDLGEHVGLTLVREHDRAVNEALLAHGGRQVKHTGDGLMASFLEPAHAVAFAIDLQRRLHAYREGQDALPLHVRVGVHVGEPVSISGDLFGLAVNIASRVCDAAQADEILVTDAVRAYLTERGPAVASRGEHTLKGLDGPTALHAVAWSDESRT